MSSHHKSYAPPADSAVRGTILALHGGCFVGGSIEWDTDQNTALSKMGFYVLQLHIPGTVDEFRTSSDSVHRNLVIDFPKPYFVLGRSSGGYLAREYMDRFIDIHKALYLCPVFNPMLRAKLLPRFAAKTQAFFGEDARVGVFCRNPYTEDQHPIDTWDMDENELLLLATKDENVPRECYTSEQLKHAVFLGPATHSGVCCTTSAKFLEIVDKHFVE
jgi:hypothetical protein